MCAYDEYSKTFKNVVVATKLNYARANAFRHLQRLLQQQQQNTYKQNAIRGAKRRRSEIKL